MIPGRLEVFERVLLITGKGLRVFVMMITTLADNSHVEKKHKALIARKIMAQYDECRETKFRSHVVGEIEGPCSNR